MYQGRTSQAASEGANRLAAGAPSVLGGDPEGWVRVVAETAQLDHNIAGFGDLSAFGNTSLSRSQGCSSGLGLSLESKVHPRCAPMRID